MNKFYFENGVVSVKPNENKWSDKKYMLSFDSKNFSGWGITKEHSTSDLTKEQADEFYTESLKLLGMSK